jgi:hypothetical protein
MEKNEGPMHYDDIMKMMLDIFPEMELGEDNEGQLIVYTGWECKNSEGFYSPIQEKE